MTTQTHNAGPAPESDEAYVREVLDAAMSGARPPLDLSTAAMARGRRLRSRRRLAVATTVAAAGALVAVAAPWLAASGDGAGTRGDDLVATQPPAPATARPAGWWDVPATDMVSAVAAILPDGVRVTDPGPLEADTPEGGPATGWINPTLTGPQGAGALNISLYPVVEGTSPTDPPVVAPQGSCDAPEHAGPVPCNDLGPGERTTLSPAAVDNDISCAAERSGPTDCVQLRDVDGTVVGRRLTGHWGGTVVNEVVLRRDGGTVYAASANTLDEKWGADSPVTATRPPLTLDQLEDLVRNDVWVTGPGT